MRLHRSHVKKLIRDTLHDKPNGPKYGILELSVRLVFEDGEVRFEPLRKLSDRIDEVLTVLHTEGYAGRHASVTTLINEARVALADSAGNLGRWEAQDLEYAQTAARANFLRLALVCVKKAIAVNKLSKDEYEAGFNYGRR